MLFLQQLDIHRIMLAVVDWSHGCLVYAWAFKDKNVDGLAEFHQRKQKIAKSKEKEEKPSKKLEKKEEEERKKDSKQLLHSNEE